MQEVIKLQEIQDESCKIVDPTLPAHDIQKEMEEREKERSKIRLERFISL